MKVVWFLGWYLAVLTVPAMAQSETMTVEGTFERVAHGTIEVRSLTDCKLRGFDANSVSKAVGNEISFINGSISEKHPLDVVVTVRPDYSIADIAPSQSTVDADKKCLTDLGTLDIEGVAEGVGYGNNAASFDLRLSSGHVVTFTWIYDYGSPKISRKLGGGCGRCGVDFSRKRVRVTYVIRSTGDGVELVRVAIDPR